MTQKEAVTVKVLDREYRIACEPGERRQLLDAADYLDQQMRQLRDTGNIVGVERVAVLAGLNIAHQLLRAEQEQKAYTDQVASRISALRSKLDGEFHPPQTRPEQ